MLNAQDIPDAILGLGKVIAVFGRWPTFHDAEVLSIELVRDEGRPLTSPVCTVAVCPMGEPGAPQSVGPVVTLRFYDVNDLQLAGFHHQNPILGLTIVTCDVARKPHPLSSHVYDVTFRGVHEGAFAIAFTCSRVEVVSVAALAGTPLAAQE